jgi:hypothetical protein
MAPVCQAPAGDRRRLVAAGHEGRALARCQVELGRDRGDAAIARRCRDRPFLPIARFRFELSSSMGDTLSRCA